MRFNDDFNKLKELEKIINTLPQGAIVQKLMIIIDI